MGLLGDIAAYIDARKRVAARNVSDLASNPGGMLNMWGNQVREDINAANPVGAPLNDPRGTDFAMNVALNAPMGLLGIISKPPKYAMSHRPMAEEGGAARLHDLVPAFGEDIYGRNALQYFGSGDKREADIVWALRSLRGNPDAEVTIYRGVPAGADGSINPGDWVTLSHNVAADYGPKVVAKKVKASDVTSWPDSLLEFGYYPNSK